MFKRASLIPSLAALMFLLVGSLTPVGAQAPAAEKPPETLEQRMERSRVKLEMIEHTLSRGTLTDPALVILRDQLEPIGETVNAILDELTPKLDGIKSRLEQLGPKPAANAPPESEGVTAERAEQDKAFKETEEVVKRARVMSVRSGQLTEMITAQRRNLFTKALFEQSSSILSPSLWLAVLAEVPREISASTTALRDWYSSINARLTGWRLPVFWGAILGLAFLYWPIKQVSRRVIKGRIDESIAPTRYQKIIAAWWIAIVIAVLPIAFVSFVSILLDVFDLHSHRMEPLLRALIEGVARVSITAGIIARGLLSPSRAGWRMVDLSDRVADRVAHLAIMLASLVSLTKILEAMNEIISASLAFSVATRGIGALLFALVLAWGLKGIMLPPDDSEECLGPLVTPERDLFAPVRLAAWCAVVLIIGSVLVGYVSLGSFVVDQVVWISAIGATLYMLVSLADEGIATGFKATTPMGRTLINTVGLRREKLDQIGTLINGVARVVLFSLAGLLMLVPWGIQSGDLAGNLRAAFFGFKVGEVTISIASIAFAVLIFSLGYIATRAVQNWLDTKFLPKTQLDTGLRNSIKTSFGYVGFAIAFAVAMAYLGLSLEKLAFVAGALSLGIGFGLQSIVSNFVSGLILLWERAVRVGDWIVVGSEQGFVRRISVRATEIETFDRATVIIPNSNLVSGVVKNWVRNDRMGRFKITIEIAHGNDPEKLRDVLLAAAKAHDLVLRIPAPNVQFSSMNASSMTFDLQCFIADVETSGRVKSDLHFDLFKRLKMEGIEITGTK